MTERIEKFVHSNPFGSIHQLPVWGEIQTSIPGRSKYWVLHAGDGSKITASALIIRQDLPFGLCWLYCPRGPLYTDEKSLKEIFHKIKELAKVEKAVFFRFDPAFQTIPVEFQLMLEKNGARPAHAFYQPESTLIIDLSQSEQEILKQMKPKGRYNIKVAEKHGVHVVSNLDTRIFSDLFAQTTARDGFQGHEPAYYEKILKTLGGAAAKLYIAESEKIPLAAAIVTYFNDTATYYYGASSNEHRNKMAPYLLHWRVMQEAKAAGFIKYDLFGIAPQPTSDVAQQAFSANNASDNKHPWASVTEFKLKFGGRVVNYTLPYEIIYRPAWYKAIKLAKKARLFLNKRG